jgi:hypothetical protein
MKVTVLATCINCPGALALKQAALDENYEVVMESVQHSDDRTERTAKAGIGLPVLVREDGALSDDAKTWISEPKKRKHVTHPIGEVIDNVSKDNS